MLGAGARSGSTDGAPHPRAPAPQVPRPSSDDARARAARARAARSGRRRAAALAGLAGLVALSTTSAVLWPGWPSRLTAGTSSAPAPGPTTAQVEDDLARAVRAGLDPAVMLTTGELAAVVPTAGVDSAGVVDPADAGGRQGGVIGGWCDDQLLEGVVPPTSWWFAGWSAATPAPPGTLPPYVSEKVLRFDRPASAADLLARTGTSATSCFDSFDSVSPGRSYAPQGVEEVDGSPVVVAVSPVANAPGVHLVRALRARGATVVDLTVRLSAPDAGDAGTTALNLLDTALSRAVAGGPDDTSGPTRPVVHRPAPRAPGSPGSPGEGHGPGAPQAAA